MWTAVPLHPVFVFTATSSAIHFTYVIHFFHSSELLRTLQHLALLPRTGPPTCIKPIRTGRAPPRIADIPLAQGQVRNAAAGAPSKDDGCIRDEEFDSPLVSFAHGYINPLSAQP
ncbi:hypothetical protein K503DRAFT_843337 [Rhizopogon vinicolor AM-OR11-026]|uniref:Uncharacterized protein n=1 Tax=Rhizopogon vinicolor AM-OR11-026 TaxID=1314800 RepID=A0A1B7N6T4_9AGAM|nr:hypothetical protein K503DRAFT_843337 [Rhizopogon vinicolor AM-OR11-026]